MKHNFIKVIVSMLFVFSFIGVITSCGERVKVEGTIVDRQHRSWTTFIMVDNVMVLQVHNSFRFILELEDGSTHRVNVGSRTFRNYRVGDTFVARVRVRDLNNTNNGDDYKSYYSLNLIF